LAASTFGHGFVKKSIYSLSKIYQSKLNTKRPALGNVDIYIKQAHPNKPILIFYDV
jgi:hypothetical protein